MGAGRVFRVKANHTYIPSSSRHFDGMKQVQMDVKCSLGRQTKSPMHISTSRLQSSSTQVGRRFMLLPLNSQPEPYGLRLAFKLSSQVIAGQTASNQSCGGEIALQSLGREASQSRGGKTVAPVCLKGRTSS